MESKKSKSANVDRLRAPIMLIGLLFTGSILLASFSYKSGIERDIKISYDDDLTEIIYIPEIKENKPEPPELPDNNITPPDENIIIDSNTQTIVKVGIVVDPPKIKGDSVIVDPPEDIIEFPDVEAMFPGGAAAMQMWISENVQYPEMAIEMNEQGKVYLAFVVEKDGSISNIEIERGVSKDLDREAKRLLRKMPNWMPGESKGSKARTRCRLPINFTLN